MSLPLVHHESFSQEGNGASTAIYTASGTHLVRVELSFTANPGSATVITAVQAGSLSKTLTTPTMSSAQSHAEANTTLILALNDTITITVTTTDPVNTVKSLFNVVEII